MRLNAESSCVPAMRPNFFVGVARRLAGRILAGTLLVGELDSAGQLLLVCSATAFASGFGAVALVWVVYRVFGFAPVVVLADVLLGGLAGFFSGALLGKLLDSWWPLLLVPLGVVLALVLPLVLRTKEDSASPVETRQPPNP